jgi:hypothetical protein
MLIVPISEFSNIQHHCQPSVPSSGMHYQVYLPSQFPCFPLESLGLIQWHESICVPMVNQGWWQV